MSKQSLELDVWHETLQEQIDYLSVGEDSYYHKNLKFERKPKLSDIYVDRGWEDCTITVRVPFTYDNPSYEADLPNREYHEKHHEVKYQKYLKAKKSYDAKMISYKEKLAKYEKDLKAYHEYLDVKKKENRKKEFEKLKKEFDD